MVIKKTELAHVCGITSAFPHTKLPEIAFAGRSNVGKSSLINTLLCRKALARTSAKPGKTQTINYYSVEGEEKLYFVDLPGYGYATAGAEARRQWGRMVDRYLHSSQDLRAVLLLIDIRHAPTAQDCQMYDWICARGYRPILIATKQDKIKRSQVQKQLKVLRDTLQADAATEILPFSSETGAGREEVWKKVEELVHHSGRTRLS